MMQELGIGVPDPNYVNPFGRKEQARLKTEVPTSWSPDLRSYVWALPAAFTGGESGGEGA